MGYNVLDTLRVWKALKGFPFIQFWQNLEMRYKTCTKHFIIWMSQICWRYETTPKCPKNDRFSTWQLLQARNSFECSHQRKKKSTMNWNVIDRGVLCRKLKRIWPFYLLLVLSTKVRFSMIWKKRFCFSTFHRNYRKTN